MKKILILSFLIYFTISVFGSNHDTTFYSNGFIQSVINGKDANETLCIFNDINGDDLLFKQNFTYEYFDSSMLMQKYIVIKEKSIDKEYWINNTDTIYNNANFDEGFINTVMKYRRKVMNNLRYSRDARRNNTEGRVIVCFFVDKDGEVNNIKTMTNIGNKLEKSAFKTIKRNRKFGKQGNRL